MDHVLPAPAETDDAPLLATFDAIYVHERGALVRLAVTMVDDPERAAEIVHDAFEKLYVRWARVRDPGAYLRTTVVNRCRSELRRRAVQRRQPPPRSGAHRRLNVVEPHSTTVSSDLGRVRDG